MRDLGVREENTVAEKASGKDFNRPRYRQLSACKKAARRSVRLRTEKNFVQAIIFGEMPPICSNESG